MSLPTSPTSPTARETPHLRLNSGQDDLLIMDTNNQSNHGQSRPGTARQHSARSLVPQQEQRPGTAPSMQRQGSSNSLYKSEAPAESRELLLPPSRSRPSRRFRDDLSPVRSPSEAGFSSRRTSWTSEGSRDSKYGPFASPFDDSRAPSRAGSDDEGVNTQTVSEKYNILPSAGLLLFPEDVEKDDWLHNPDPNEKEKLQFRDCFSKRGLVNVGGLVFLIGGILVLFIVYPILYVLFARRLGMILANLDQDFRAKRNQSRR